MRVSLFRVNGIKVLADRMAFDLTIPEERFRTTTPRIAARAAALRPNLPIHACVNSKGRTFAAVMGRTPMPHLLEHCIIDFLVEAAEDDRASYQGTSRWIDQAAGRALVQVSMKDDLALLRAFKRAVCFLEEEVMADEAGPDRQRTRP